MANPEHLKILKRGVREWNGWREDNNDVKPDLISADLRKVPLRGANLSEASLRKADLRGADLRGADIGDRFFGISLTSITEFFNADLRETNLCGANLSEASLRGANLTEAKFGYSTIGFTDLSHCIGLENIKHTGPSIIEGRTTKLDFKNLPKEFLKGCGLNKWQIEAIKLNDPDLNETEITDIVYEIDRLRNISPIQLYNLFISYSRKDEPFVEYLEKVFRNKDIRFWRDKYHMTAGPIEYQIDQAIGINETMLLILSDNSVNSDWVEYEVSKARELEKHLNRPVICPVALDDTWKDAPWPNVLMNQVKKYNILDFSEWRDEEVFQRQFSKLLKGLNIFYRKEAE